MKTNFTTMPIKRLIRMLILFGSIICFSQQSMATCSLTGSISQQNTVLNASVSGGTGSYNYHWSRNVYFSTNSPTQSVINNGIYSVTVTDSLGCSIVLHDTVSSLPCSIQDSISYQSLGSGQYRYVAHTTGVTAPAYTWYTNGSGTLISESGNTATYALPPGMDNIVVYIQDSITNCYIWDSVTITVPGSGPNQIICEYPGIVTMAATDTGVWSAFASNPQFTTIDTPSSPHTHISGLTSIGVYGFVWTTGSSHDTMTVTVDSAYYAGGNIFASHTTVCFGQADTFTAAPYDVYSPTLYHWYRNGILVSTSAIYITSSLTNNDIIWLEFLSGDSCYFLTNDSAQSNSITITVANCGCHLAGSITQQNNFLNDDLTTNVTGGSGGYSYHWSHNAYFNSYSGTQVNNNGVYTVTITDDTTGCQIVLTDTVSNLSCSIRDTITYQYLGAGQYHFVAHVSGTTAPIYTWSVNSSGNIIGTDSIDYTLTGSNQVVNLNIQDSITGCTLMDSVIINAPGFGPAGPDQSICANATATMAATGTGTWSAMPGNPAATTITTSSSPTTTISGFTVSGIYSFIWTTGGIAYVMHVTVNATPATPHLTLSGSCLGHDTLSVQGAGSNTIGWLIDGGPWTPTANDIPTMAGQYVVYTTSSCGVQSGISDTVTVTTCVMDTVWPGDADRNKFVDNADLLTIGLGYDSTGPVRTVQGIVWQGDLATDWAHSFTIYAPTVNFVHADCNGDGIINADDTLAIVTNFGDIHAKTDGYSGSWRSGISSLWLNFSQDTLLNGDTMTVNIILGDSSRPANNIYGLAFTFHYDPLVIDTNASSFAFTTSWLGNSSNSINLHKNFNSGMVKAAITGIDHTARSGNGKIATFVAPVTTGNINGKNLSYYTNIDYISDIIAIDQYGNPVPLNAGIDSNHIGYLPNGIRDISSTAVKVYPNPAYDRIIATAVAAITEVSITDMLGKDVLTIGVNNKHSETIDVSSLASGVYTIHVSTADGSAKVRLIINR